MSANTGRRPIHSKACADPTKVKAGMTGWAQVHGWRGDTSLHERIEHDIYYIQNWSLGFDVQILLMTFWSVIRGRNASRARVLGR